MHTIHVGTVWEMVLGKQAAGNEKKGNRRIQKDMEPSTHKSGKTARNSFMLLLAALVWGVAFVAQSEGLNYVKTFTFNTCRFLLGGAVLIPCIFFLHGRKDSMWQTLTAEEKKK